MCCRKTIKVFRMLVLFLVIAIGNSTCDGSDGDEFRETF